MLSLGRKDVNLHQAKPSHWGCDVQNLGFTSPRCHKLHGRVTWSFLECDNETLNYPSLPTIFFGSQILGATWLAGTRVSSTTGEEKTDILGSRLIKRFLGFPIIKFPGKWGITRLSYGTLFLQSISRWNENKSFSHVLNWSSHAGTNQGWALRSSNNNQISHTNMGNVYAKGINDIQKNVTAT